MLLVPFNRPKHLCHVNLTSNIIHKTSIAVKRKKKGKEYSTSILFLVLMANAQICHILSKCFYDSLINTFLYLQHQGFLSRLIYTQVVKQCHDVLC